MKSRRDRHLIESEPILSHAPAAFALRSELRCHGRIIEWVSRQTLSTKARNQSPSTGAVVVPIFQTSTYVQEALGQHKGYEYSRTGNPTRAALEHNLAALEHGRAALAFASGMAAINAVMTLLKSGDHVICSQEAYGGVPRLFNAILKTFGPRIYVRGHHCSGECGARDPAQHKMVYVETPTNPLMNITDLAVIARSPARETFGWWWTTRSSHPTSKTRCRSGRT